MQQPKRFQAPTLSEAYAQVRQEMGDGAVILSTRKAFAPGLFGQPGRQFVEVVARLEPPAPDVRRPTLSQDAAGHDLVRSVAEAMAAAPLADSAPAAAPAARESTPRRRAASPAPTVSAPAAPAASAVPVAALPVPGADQSWGRQLDEMRDMLQALLSSRAEDATTPRVPSMSALQARLMEHGLSARLAAEIAAEVDLDADEETQRQTAERALAVKLPPALSVPVMRRRAIFLVGPAGAGKTTMALRLALDLEREHGLRVVVAGTDVNRAGAPQQLGAFGAVTGVQTELCYAPGDLEDLLAQDAVDVVIVDTPGHNGQRADRMAELDAFLQTARQRLVLLTLPAMMKASDLSEVVSAFGEVGVDGLVLTRCDETAHVGALAEISIETGLGVAYTTHSDQVSDPPSAGDGGALAVAAVRAEWTAMPAPPAFVPAGAERRLARVG